MSWSYDPKLESNKDRVRFLIDDTDDLDQLLQDEEINFALSQWGNIYRTGSALCETLAMKFAKQVGILDTRGVNWDPAKQAEKYKELAKTIKAMASETGGAAVFAGGISVSGKEALDNDDDRVKPAFTANQHRNPNAIQDADSIIKLDI